MKFKPTKKQTKQFYKLMSDRYDVKIIYTGGPIGCMYKKFAVIPVINKALKETGAGGRPEEWLEDRIITAGRYILMNDKPGTDNHYINWNQIKILTHECMHKDQQDRIGTVPFYYKYIGSKIAEANFELEAVTTELYMDLWNEIPLPSPKEATEKLSRIYGFDEGVLNYIEERFKTIINNGFNNPHTLYSNVTGSAVEILDQIK